MRYFIILLLVSLSVHAAETAPNTKPDAGGVLIEPSEGEIEPGTTLTFTFPTAMVGADRIDVADQPLPFLSKPQLQGGLLWKSATECVFTVQGVIPGTTYRLTLAPRLADASGKPVEAPDWSAGFTTPSFSLTTDFEESEHLSSRPQIPLESTYGVRFSEVVEHSYFQDRDSRQRFPAEVVQSGENPAEGREFRVGPREPLPVNRTYDLIVDGLLEAKTRQPLPYLKAFPAGTTVPLKVEWVGAFNHPLEDPEIDIKFNDEIDPAQAVSEKIRVEPSVQKLQMQATGQNVIVKGDFDPAQHYRVTVSPDLKGVRGYGLSAESRWGATFHPKEPCLVFPSSQLFLRARQELRFSFLQINTPRVTWKLARIPAEKLGAVKARLSEFEQQEINPLTGKPLLDPRTGFAKARPTDLLVDAFALPVVSSGTVDAASGDAETVRDIRCAPGDGKPLSGAYLLEASAQLSDGHLVGNRSIVFVSDFILSEKRTRTTTVVRIANMSDARPVANVIVRAVTDENIELARSTTDRNGIATFARSVLFPQKQPRASLFIAETENGPALRPAGPGSGYTSGEDQSLPAAKHRAVIITDRNLYRPGQVVKMKGMMRDATETGLAIPATHGVRWEVRDGEGERVLHEADATLSDDGAWEAAWEVPDKASTGHYQLRCKIGNDEYNGTAAIDIEEYRVPLFSVIVEAGHEIGTAAHARISSAYFHGAPNVGARVHWKATWTASAEIHENDLKCYNAYGEVGPRLDPDTEQTQSIEGDTKLDERGFASLECESPFKANAAIGRCTVSWRAEVTSLDGQTITGGAMAETFSAGVRLGVMAREHAGPNGGVNVKIEALNPDDQMVNDVAVHADLYHVVTKTVKEQVGPFVYHYRNTDLFTKVASQETKTPGDLLLPATETGRYVVAISAPGQNTPLVSDETTVTGEEAAELPVENETSFQIDHRGEPFAPGEIAVLTTKAPLTGLAWVSVETDEILDTLLVPLTGNAGRIELPVKKEYAPNAFVSVYLTRPGGEGKLPRERFAFTELAVRRPDRELKVEPRLSNAAARPGETIRGDVRVTCDGKSTPEADLAVFVVDDAVLQLGDWHLPDLIAGFYYRREFGVRSFESLASYQEEISSRNLTQKGFIIGDGGEEKVGNVPNVRKEFRTLAFWQGNLKTDQDGNASFEFTAPDNLTTYRVVAVAETKEGQFGGDAGVTLKISKPILVDAALPRFLRNGDEVELRAVVRQSFADSDEVHVRCLTDASCQLTAATESTQTAGRNVPVVFRFKAKVTDNGLLPAKIGFDATAQSNPKMVDSIELTLPVEPPTILRTESVAGSFTGPNFDVKSALPEPWKSGHGKLDVTVSSSEWLPEIAGLPAILDYPHGCFEQISTRLLGYALLGNLLAYLPNAEARDAEYRAIIERGLQQFDASLLDNGMLPYWPGGTSGHAFVTAQAFWAVNEAANAGFNAPERLAEQLRGALTKIVERRAPASEFDRIFALFVLSQSATAEDFADSAEEMYLRRNETDDEGRALLALALNHLNTMAKEQEQLLREIDAPVKERAFDPLTLTSTTRAEAICALALKAIAPKIWTPEKQRRIRDRLLTLMSSAGSFSTQENLWLLLAFKSMVSAENAEPLKVADIKSVVSKNRCSAAWLDRPLSELPLVEGLNEGRLTYLMKAVYATDAIETDRLDRGFRVERVVRNLTDPKRRGDANAPFKLGDQILITYRVNTRKLQNYVALEDALPAGLETVNPDLAMIGKFFEIPPDNTGDRVLSLSHSEMRDRSTRLYFDVVDPGSATYSVLARATAAGTFRWPATQVVPMYDSRFSGLSPSSICFVSGE
ncbi:MAG: hypothetical protein JOZ21_04735 [Verrucomicrobia bacterium]|nr:hypothetical protein [Verrucomicrobiota bacterium]